MDGVNRDTVWTWNAIGKRAGAWRLDRRRAGGHARLPAQSPDRRAAAGARGRLSLLQQRPDHRPGRLVRPAGADREGRGGGGRRKLAAIRAAARAGARRRPRHDRLPEATGKKLGLVIDLDTCVGCQACATSCKEWNAGGYSAPLTDQDAHGARSARRLAQPRALLRGGRGRRRPHRAFPTLLPALRDAGLRHGLPDRRLLQARRGRHRAGQSRHLHRLQAVLLGVPLWRARIRLRRRHR